MPSFICDSKMNRLEKVLASIWIFTCLVQAFLYDPLVFLYLSNIDKYFFGPTTIDNLLKIDVVNLYIFFAPMLICAIGFGFYGLYKLIQKKA